MQAYRFVTVIYSTKKSLSTFWDTYALVIFNRNREKDSEKLSAPVSETVLEYELSFQVERQRKFIAVIFVRPLTRILIKVFSSTFICLLYCRMHINKTHQLSVLCIDSTRTTESCHFKISRETKSVLCRIATWDFSGDAFASLTTSSRIACVAVVERGRGRGLGEREKTHLLRRLFTDHYGVAQETRTIPSPKQSHSTTQF